MNEWIYPIAKTDPYAQPTQTVVGRATAYQPHAQTASAPLGVSMAAPFVTGMTAVTRPLDDNLRLRCLQLAVESKHEHPHCDIVAAAQAFLDFVLDVKKPEASA